MVWNWFIGSSLIGLAFRLGLKILEIWNKLDDKTKKKIIEAVVDAFELILRAYYKSWKSRR